MTVQQRRWLATIALAQAVVAVLAWRDLAGRSDERVRGKRRVWQAAVVLHPGNAVWYWLLGRR